MLPPGKVRGFDVDAFGRLPVLEGGRVKPIDSVARNSLLMIRSQQSLRYEGRTIGADEWLLDLMFRPRGATSSRSSSSTTRTCWASSVKRLSSDRYFSMRDLGPTSRSSRSRRRPPRRSTPSSAPASRARSSTSSSASTSTTGCGTRCSWPRPPAGGRDQRAAAEAAQRLGDLAELALFRPLPPLAGEPADAWHSVGEALQVPAGTSLDLAWAAPGLTSAYATGDAQAFNRR